MTSGELMPSDREWQKIVDEFCDFTLSVGSFRGRDHDIQHTVDASWTALRKRAGRLYGKYGKHYEARLKRGFVTMAGEPVNPLPYQSRPPRRRR